MTTYTTSKELTDEVGRREMFFKELVESTYVTDSYYSQEHTQILLARKWNSWYPTYFETHGGCYAILTSDQDPCRITNCGVIVIDPGFDFMAILRKTANIEPQDIKTVVVTHYHPDHVAGLMEFATLKTASRSPCDFYLNETTFRAYHRMQSKELTFHEIHCGQTLLISEYTSFDGCKEQIFLNTTRAYHEELGHAYNSLGLKFSFLKDGRSLFRFSITGDTDGNSAYIKEYARNYADSDLLIAHLGTFSNTKYGRGGKHLYPIGVDLLLDEIKITCAQDQGNMPKRTLVLSEFGLELGTQDQIGETLRPSINSLSWRLPLILAVKLRKSESFQRHMYSMMTAAYLCSAAECTKRNLDQVLLSMGVSALSVMNPDTKGDLLLFTSTIDQKLTQYHGKEGLVALSIDKGREILRENFKPLASEAQKLTKSISEMSHPENGLLKASCVFLVDHLLSMIAKRHLALIVQPTWESVLEYSRALKLSDAIEASWGIDIGFSKSPVLPAALCSLLALYEDCSQSQSHMITIQNSTPENDENLLMEISRMFQQTHGNWCKIMIGEMGSRFSFDNQGQALVLTKGGAWVPLWNSVMAYDKETKTIFYESEENTEDKE